MSDETKPYHVAESPATGKTRDKKTPPAGEIRAKSPPPGQEKASSKTDPKGTITSNR